MTPTQPVIDMNLTDYLKHKEDCEITHKEKHLNNLIAVARHESTRIKLREWIANIPHGLCSCSLSSLQSRLVLLPEDFKQKLLELLHEAASKYSRDGGWESFTALHSDEFEAVVGDIEKMLKG